MHFERQLLCVAGVTVWPLKKSFRSVGLSLAVLGHMWLSAGPLTSKPGPLNQRGDAEDKGHYLTSEETES